MTKPNNKTKYGDFSGKLDSYFLSVDQVQHDIVIPPEYFIEKDEKAVWYGNPKKIPKTLEDLVEQLDYINKRYQSNITGIDQADLENRSCHLVLKKDNYFFKFLNLTRLNEMTGEEFSDESPENEWIAFTCAKVLGKPELVAKTLVTELNISGRVYKVQISQSQGENLSAYMKTYDYQSESFHHENYGWQYLLALFLSLGDAKSDNYTVKNKKLVLIDNEMVLCADKIYRSHRGVVSGVNSVLFQKNFIDDFILPEEIHENIKKYFAECFVTQEDEILGILKNLRSCEKMENAKSIISRWYNCILDFNSKYNFLKNQEDKEKLWWKISKFLYSFSKIKKAVTSGVSKYADLLNNFSPELKAYFDDKNELYKDPKEIMDYIISKDDEANFAIQTSENFHYELFSFLSEFYWFSDKKLYNYAEVDNIPLAQLILGFLYENIGKRSNQEKEQHKNARMALNYYKKAADNGNIHANCILGWIFESDSSKNIFKKLKQENSQYYYEKAAEKQVPYALYRLSCILKESKEKEDLVKAIRFCVLSAEQGFANAQRLLGAMYEIGIKDNKGQEILPKDMDKAQSWYKLAARQGDEKAMAKLGRLYYSEDKKESFNWFMKAAQPDIKRNKIGCPYSQHKVGSMYKKGFGVSKNNEKALYWFKKSAQQGSIWAKNSLAEIFEYGLKDGQREIVPINKKKAFELYKTTALEGSTYGLCNLARMYEFGVRDEKTGRDVVPLDKKKAMAMYEQIGEKDTRALCYLGRLYADGVKDGKTVQDALSLYKKAIGGEKNFDEAVQRRKNYENSIFHKECLNIENAELEGDGDFLDISENDADPFFICEEEVKKEPNACFRIVPEAFYELGILYENGMLDQDDNVILEKNEELSESLYGIAFSKKVQDRANKKEQIMSKLFNQGKNFLANKEFEKAKISFIKAFLFFDHRSAYELSKIYKAADQKDKYLDWLIKSAKRGNFYAQYELAEFYKEIEDIQNALEWYSQVENNQKAKLKNLNLVQQAIQQKKGIIDLGQKFYQEHNIYQAAKYNHKKALRIIADRIENTGNLEGALSYYVRAANLGEFNAQIRLAKIYKKGVLHVKKDVFECVKWYRECFENKKTPQSIKNQIQGKLKSICSELYQKADSFLQAGESYKAFEYFEAASYYDFRAMDRLAKMYEEGEGVEKSELAAFRWYKKAAEQGNFRAQFHLGQMYENGRAFDNEEKTQIKSIEDAVYWYQQSCNNPNNSRAIYPPSRDRLWEISNKSLEEGKRLCEEAKTCFERSANLGNFISMDFMGQIYMTAGIFRKEGQNFDLAENWYQKAVKNKNKHANKHLKQLQNIKKKEFSGDTVSCVSYLSKPDSFLGNQEKHDKFSPKTVEEDPQYRVKTWLSSSNPKAKKIETSPEYLKKPFTQQPSVSSILDPGHSVLTSIKKKEENTMMGQKKIYQAPSAKKTIVKNQTFFEGTSVKKQEFNQIDTACQNLMSDTNSVISNQTIPAQNIQTQRQEILKKALSGDFKSQNELIKVYKEKNGTLGIYDDEQIAQEAPVWLEQSAMQEKPNYQATFLLFEAYCYGKWGFEKNIEKAKYWLDKAATQKNPDYNAQFLLFESYRDGELGFAKNAETANYWLHKAADRGHKVAIKIINNNKEFLDETKKKIK